jgi:hypothetical protein
LRLALAERRERDCRRSFERLNRIKRAV